MIRKTIFLLALVLTFMTGCFKSTNSAEFIDQATGRYLYNSDEVLEVYFIEDELYIKWRGADAIHPLKIGDNSFYIKEMNEKVEFLTDSGNQEYYITVISKENDSIEAPTYRKLGTNEFTPLEYLNKGDFDSALAGYLMIQKRDSLDPVLEESTINRWGYDELREENVDRAYQIFLINLNLYPNSSNVYDSYGEAILRKGDTLGAIENYKKALEIDPENDNARRMLRRIEKN